MHLCGRGEGQQEYSINSEEFDIENDYINNTMVNQLTNVSTITINPKSITKEGL